MYYNKKLRALCNGPLPADTGIQGHWSLHRLRIDILLKKIKSSLYLADMFFASLVRELFFGSFDLLARVSRIVKLFV